ncbi:SDR family NAD(P)-dependent oxidoreductase [Amphritea sp.]|uniref:SDR family NAD(P)-dependent oxidoreductase n=1 Tax=Amphritea sp. TaxID=1872502 RepID=UPI003A909300
MQKTILITGSTDGIGFETAKMLRSLGHHILLHGRNAAKLAAVEKQLAALPGEGKVEGFIADLSQLSQAYGLADKITQQTASLDVLINNAGIYNLPASVSNDEIDPRFTVNTLAPFVLTQRLLSLLGASGRVINLSSAAQAPVDLEMLAGPVNGVDDFSAYAQSKLALTMWSRHLALALGDTGPAIIAVNPGSMLGSKMVKNAFGVAGGDLSKGAKILTRAALDDEFASATGLYFDNDAGDFGAPHMDALDPLKNDAVVQAIDARLDQLNLAAKPS